MSVPEDVAGEALARREEVPDTTVRASARPMSTAGSGRLPEEATGYVGSISAKTKVRRLHFLGACHRVPGLDYLDFELLGSEVPDCSLYDAYCAQCWAAGKGPPAARQRRGRGRWGHFVLRSVERSRGPWGVTQSASLGL